MYNVWATIKYQVEDEESIDETIYDLEEALRNEVFTYDEVTWEHEEADNFS